MVAALEDDQGRPLLVKAIHKAVFLIDAAGPAPKSAGKSAACQVMVHSSYFCCYSLK